jgi:DNA-binding response OmpR family regulator
LVAKEVAAVNVLLAEGDEPLAQTLRSELEEEGFTVSVVDPEEADRAGRSSVYDVILLELPLSEDDGRARLRRWRRDGLETPILVLTAGSAGDRVGWLDAGADACLTRPCQVQELAARLRALVRCGHPVKNSTIRIHDLEIDPEARTVRRAGHGIRLTPREYALLLVLASRRGKVTSRAIIQERLYGEPRVGTSNVVDVYIRYLRNKIDRGFSPPLILTRWSEGYLLQDDR